MENTAVGWRAAALVGLVASLGSACWTQSLDVVWSDGAWSWRRLAVQVGMGTILVGGGWFLGMRLAQRGRSYRGSRLVVELLSEVQRTGTMQEGLDSASWRPALARRRRDLTWIAVLSLALGALVAVPVAAAAYHSHPQDLGIWALAVALVVLALGAIKVALRQRRTVDGVVALLT